jgi:protein structure with unknown function
MNGSPKPRIAWPAVLAYAGADQLCVVDNQDEWDVDPELHAWPYRDEDRLIDSKGIEYALEPTGRLGADAVRFVPTGKVLSAGEMRERVAGHLRAIKTPEEWLDAYLQEFSEALRVSAALQYVARLEKADEAGETGETGEDEE